MDTKKTLLFCAGIISVGALITILIFNTEPEAEQSGATKQTAMLVNTTLAERGNYRPTISATGVVRAAREITLQPRVSGEVTDRSTNFDPGGFVNKGDQLLRIDPSDFEIRLQQQKSNLRQAEADMRIEMGLQEVARREYRLLEDTLSNENKDLLLREPQLAQVRSAVEAARANLRQAELDLERTRIRAPFNAQIMSRNVDIGSQVAVGQSLGRLVGLDNFWVQASVPVSKLQWLTFSEDNAANASGVQINNRSAWKDQAFRSGTLYRLIGSIEENTRLATVLINVQDPLALNTDDPVKRRLILGSFVEVNIEGKELEDVVRLDRDLLRADDTVWVMSDDTLSIKNVDVVFKDEMYAYLSAGLNEDDQVVATNLSTVVEGSALRTESN